MIENSKNLEEESKEALRRWNESTKNIENLDKNLIILCAKELEYHLNEYLRFHQEAKKETRSIEKRRQDHWDLLNKKCKEDPMFQDLWNELLTLMSLEEENQKSSEDIERLKAKNTRLLK